MQISPGHPESHRIGETLILVSDTHSLTKMALNPLEALAILLLEHNPMGAFRATARPHFAVAGLRQFHSHSRRVALSPVLQEDASTVPVSWIEVADVPSVEAAEGATVLPVFPMNTVEWPGTNVSLNIIDPGYRRMYDDILLSGARRFLLPWSPCVSGFPRGRVRFAEIPEEERRLHAVGVVLYLEDLREVSEASGDRVKYQVRHKVLGRARMTRLLNPSALYRTNEEGNKIDYLRAEVELYDEQVDQDDGPLPSNLAAELSEVWSELTSLAARTNEPRARSSEVLQNLTMEKTSWQLAEFWQGWQLMLCASREQARAMVAITDWIAEQHRQGKLPEGIPEDFDPIRLGVPEPLLMKLLQTQSSAGCELSTEFWEPLLRLQAAEETTERGKLILESARGELQTMRARAALGDLSFN